MDEFHRRELPARTRRMLRELAGNAYSFDGSEVESPALHAPHERALETRGVIAVVAAAMRRRLKELTLRLPDEGGPEAGRAP